MLAGKLQGSRHLASLHLEQDALNLLEMSKCLDGEGLLRTILR